MLIDEGKLRAYLDQALSPAEVQVVETALATSTTLQVTLDKLRLEQAEISAYLDQLGPSPAARPVFNQAWLTMQTKLAGESKFKLSIRTKERMFTMFKKSPLKQYQPIITSLAIVAVIALLFSFAPVRSLAGQFLNVFRVQDIQVVPVDVNRLEDNLQGNPELQGVLQQVAPESKVVTGGGEPQIVESINEATALIDFTPARINALPDNVNGSRRIFVQEHTVVSIQFDKAILDAVFEAAKIDLTLPDSINETPILVTKPATLVEVWGSEGRPSLTFVQLHSPEIEYPDDLDLNAVGIAGLQLLGKSKVEAMAMASTIDWANTLILPIPTDADVDVQEVTVNGDKGTIFTHDNSRSPRSDFGPGNNHRGKHRVGGEIALLWQADGITYLLGGQYTADELLAMAESVK